MKKVKEDRFFMWNCKFMITNFMFQVFFAALKTTPSFIVQPQLLKIVYLSNNPPVLL